MKKVMIFVLIALAVIAISAFQDSIALAPRQITNCQHMAPTIIAHPTSNQSLPGTQLIYDLEITNNNLGPCRNSEQGFNLFDIGHNGWASNVSTSTVFLCSGAGSCNTTYNEYYKVTSPFNVTNGNYSFHIIAFEPGQNQAGLVTVTYII